LDGPTTGSTSVNYQINPGSADIPSDVVSTHGQLTFGPVPVGGRGIQAISVPIVGDTVIEPDETFFVSLSLATNGALIPNPDFEFTIVNDDGPVVTAPANQ